MWPGLDERELQNGTGLDGGTDTHLEMLADRKLTGLEISQFTPATP